jgi:hypothetical protein
MAKQESITLPEFQKRYRDENACREHLFAIRWPLLPKRILRKAL